MWGKKATTSLTSTTDKEIEDGILLLNLTLRKVFGGLTPLEAFTGRRVALIIWSSPTYYAGMDADFLRYGSQRHPCFTKPENLVSWFLSELLIVFVLIFHYRPVLSVRAENILSTHSLFKLQSVALIVLFQRLESAGRQFTMSFRRKSWKSLRNFTKREKWSIVIKMK